MNFLKSINYQYIFLLGTLTLSCEALLIMMMQLKYNEIIMIHNSTLQLNISYYIVVQSESHLHFIVKKLIEQQ